MSRMEDKGGEKEKILPARHEFSPEFLDAATGILLQVCEEVDEPSFTELVMHLMNAFDGEIAIDPDDENRITQTLMQMRKSFGMNTYCLLRGLLSHLMGRKKRALQWFSLIALNSFRGNEFKIYEMVVGGRLN